MEARSLMSDVLYHLHEEFGRNVTPEDFEKIKKFIGHFCAPDEVFSEETLKAWAEENGWFPPENEVECIT